MNDDETPKPAPPVKLEQFCCRCGDDATGAIAGLYYCKDHIQKAWRAEALKPYA